MKKMREMDSQAGTSSTVEVKGLNAIFSKSASLLLVIMLGFSSMSFVQDEALVSNSDTNQSLSTAKNLSTAREVSANAACCVIAAVNPGKGVDGPNFISIPGKTAMYKADRETIVSFIKEARERKIWSLNRKSAAAKADQAMFENFKLSSIYPSDRMMVAADKEVGNLFVETVVKGIDFSANAALIADKEMTNQFVANNLSVKMYKPEFGKMIKADSEMHRIFEETNRPVITLPSAESIKKADESMIQRNGVL